MTDIWESAPLTVEVWESQTQPGVVFETVVREGSAGGGAVDSVDGRTGVVELDDLYEPIGAAAALASSLGSAAFRPVTDFASAAQGALADTAVQPTDIGLVAETGLIGDNHIPASIARDTEVAAAVVAHDASPTAHPDIRALAGGMWRRVASHIATGNGDWPIFVNVPDARAWRLSWFIGSQKSSTGGLQRDFFVRFDSDAGNNYTAGTGASFAATAVQSTDRLALGAVGQGGSGSGQAIISRAASGAGWVGALVRSNYVSATSGGVAPGVRAGAYAATGSTPPPLSRWELSQTAADVLVMSGDLFILEVLNV